MLTYEELLKIILYAKNNGNKKACIKYGMNPSSLSTYMETYNRNGEDGLIKEYLNESYLIINQLVKENSDLKKTILEIKNEANMKGNIIMNYAPETRIRKSWTEWFNEFLEFKRKYGTTKIPYKKKEYTPLRQWCNTQRAAYKIHMPKDRIEKLKNIGFEFEIHKTAWSNSYNELEEYNKRIGNIDIRYKDPNYYKLSVWLNNQKRFYRSGKLKPDRIEKLKKLGATWIK